MDAKEFVALVKEKLPLVSYRIIANEPKVSVVQVLDWIVELSFKDRVFCVCYRSRKHFKFSLSEEFGQVWTPISEDPEFEIFENAESTIDRIYDLYRNEKYIIDD